MRACDHVKMVCLSWTETLLATMYDILDERRTSHEIMSSYIFSVIEYLVSLRT